MTDAAPETLEQAGDAEEVLDEDVLDVDPDQEVITTTYDITSYGADYPVDGLVKRLEQKDIVIPSFDPVFTESTDVQGFQRRFVWTRPQMDKFVESLLLGLPVPGSSWSERLATNSLSSTVSNACGRCRRTTEASTTVASTSSRTCRTGSLTLRTRHLTMRIDDVSMTASSTRLSCGRIIRPGRRMRSTRSSNA